MLTNTSVNGYKLLRLHPTLGTIEEWKVGKEIKTKVEGVRKKVVSFQTIGIISKANFRPFGPNQKPIKLWFFIVYKRLGWREIQISKVANTRQEIVRLLTE